jgi:surface polysaccharide O-acyltransferase-like enzyme
MQEEEDAGILKHYSRLATPLLIVTTTHLFFEKWGTNQETCKKMIIRYIHFIANHLEVHGAWNPLLDGNSCLASSSTSLPRN